MLASDSVIGGFERDRFTAPLLIDSSLLCPICLAVFRPPIIQLACSRQHQFCQVCIEKWFAEKANDRTCPCCRSPVATSSSLLIVNDGTIFEMLSALELRCRHQSYGCTAVVAVTEIGQHEFDCVFQPVRCPTPGCYRIFARNQQQDHLDKDCPRCSTCGYSLSADQQNGEDHSEQACRTLQRVTHFRGDYWNKLVTSQADAKAMTTPSEVVEIVSHQSTWLNSDQQPGSSVFVVCKDGQLQSFAVNGNGNNNGNGNGGRRSSIHWQTKVRVAIPDDTKIRSPTATNVSIFHAALATSSDDATKFSIFFTVTQPWLGIFYTTSSDLDQFSANEWSLDDDQLTDITLKMFVAGSKMHESTSRLFRGLASIEQHRLLACCHECPNVIGLWALDAPHRGQLLSQVCMPQTLMPECEFSPFKCAAFVAPTYVPSSWSKSEMKISLPYCASGGSNESRRRALFDARTDILLAVSEFENDRVHLFSLAKLSATTYTCDMVQTVAKKGTLPGCVWRPRCVSFDPVGNLLVVDSGNNRLQIFSAMAPSLAGDNSPRGIVNFLAQQPLAEVTWRSVWTSSPFQNNCQNELEIEQLRQHSSAGANNSPLTTPTLFRRRFKPHPHWTSSLAVQLDSHLKPLLVVGFYDNKHVIRFHM